MAVIAAPCHASTGRGGGLLMLFAVWSCSVFMKKLLSVLLSSTHGCVCPFAVAEMLHFIPAAIIWQTGEILKTQIPFALTNSSTGALCRAKVPETPRQC